MVNLLTPTMIQKMYLDVLLLISDSATFFSSKTKNNLEIFVSEKF